MVSNVCTKIEDMISNLDYLGGNDSGQDFIDNMFLSQA